MDHRSQSTADRPIRLLTILAFAHSFALLLPHGLNTNQIVPALGILPMAFSACTGIIHLAQKAELRGASIAMDLFCACFLIGVFIPSCVSLACTGHALAADQTVLGTFGVAPMMLNIAIHSWFFLRNIKWRRIFRMQTCPHCRGESRRGQGYISVDSDEIPRPGDKEQAPSSNAHAYADEDGRPSSAQEPRPSADDEAARLV